MKTKLQFSADFGDITVRDFGETQQLHGLAGLQALP